VTIAAKAYIAFITLLGSACAAFALLQGPPRDLPRSFCYLLLAIPASGLKVSLPGITGTMSVLFLFLLAGTVELGPAETMFIGATCVIVQSFWHARVRPKVVHLLFSVANITIAVFACYFVYHLPILVTASTQSAFRLALAAAVFFVVNTFPIAAVIALTEDKSLGKVWKECYCWSFPYYLVGAAIVGVFTFSNRMFDWQVWVLILPVVYVIYRSYRLYIDRLNAQRLQAEQQRRHAEQVAALHEEALNALRCAVEANAKLDAVIQASPLAILALDPNGSVQTWNSTAERMFGVSSENALHQSLPIRGEGAESVKEAIVRQTLDGEFLSGLEVTHQREDGTSFHGAVWTAPLRDTAGNISGILVTLADVTRRKRLEEQLRVSQRMEAVGRLAGGIAHDFNNLLTIINGYGYMLQDSLKSQPYVAGQAEEILKAGERAADLVAKLLAFSRRQILEPKRIRINDLVQNVERMLRRLIGEHIELRTDL
jgi:PAS domain S-box-containing protein